jgi:hypothetical protein
METNGVLILVDFFLFTTMRWSICKNFKEKKKTKELQMKLMPPYVTLAYFGYPIQAIWLYCSQRLKLIGDFERT